MAILRYTVSGIAFILLGAVMLSAVFLLLLCLARPPYVPESEHLERF